MALAMWIARGVLTVLDGDPGLGKSTITADLAARVSRGRAMPGEADAPRAAAGVLIASAEDSAARTIRPRLAAMDADLSRIRIIDDVSDSTDAGEDSRHLQLPIDVPLIERQMIADDAALLIVDPLMAYVGRDRHGRRIDAHREQSARVLLGELSRLAAATDAAVVVIRHLNKSARRNSLYRGSGSIGITAAARSVLLVGRDPEDSESRVLAMVKGNLSARPRSLQYRLAETGGAVGVEWGSKCDWFANDLVRQDGPGRDDKPVDPACLFLRKALGSGGENAEVLYKRAEREGISRIQLWRASRKIGLIKLKLGMKSGWFWELSTEPGADDPPPLSD